MFPTAHNNNAGGNMMQTNNNPGASSSVATNGASNQLPPPEQGYLSQPNMPMGINYPIPQHPNYHSTNSYQTPLMSHNNPPTPSKSNTSQGMINPSTGQQTMENQTSVPPHQPYQPQPLVHNSPGKAGYYSAPNAGIASSSNQNIPPQYVVDNHQHGYTVVDHQNVAPTSVNQVEATIEEPRTRASDEPQLVFSCKHCRTIFIDSNALFFNGEEHGIITFLKVHKVEVRENVQIAPNDRFDAGSNYYPLFCKQCQTLVGRKYLMSDKSPIVDIIGYYTLDIDALSLYEMWTAEQETGEIQGGHIDNIKSIPTNRSIMKEITLLKNALLMLQHNQSSQGKEIHLLKQEINGTVDKNDSVKKIPELIQKMARIEKELNISQEEQKKISHINRRLNNEVGHIKKETGITPLGTEPIKPPPPTNQPSNKKRASMGSTTAAIESSHTPETTNSKKKKTK
ncbi:predicted protein [Naegleria gruberi]|uniref:Predicted protein n=1 Tax=Naegleria gruberi TaxID=5762 RepID=D2VXI9_NAEGR|nr:uncharacterized protein NAEGRDRAFT_73763 [Naegleria gruberi]EFC38446.1 predicted protein [Naegleria gruberi]|eukprot:XP_002671190.1 predicted protein [Naegleria gruberi strain NEG-M]